MLGLCARSYLALARYERYERLRVAHTPRYPEEAARLDALVWDAFGEHWGLPPEFSCEKLAEQACLQTWTLKPAWLHPPRGHSRNEGRIALTSS